MNSELNQSVILEAEVLGIQNVAQTDHSKLDNLDFEHSGHTGFQPAGNYVEDSNYTHTDNNYTTEEKTKLSNLENYDDTEVKADIGALEDIETTQNEEIVNIKANKADKSEIPDVSDFITNSVNDLINYYLKSETYTKTEVNNLIGAINQFHYEIVQALPITGENNILYLVPKSTSETENIYDEYVYASGWEKIGDTEIDLSNYVTTTQLNTALADYTTTANLTTLLAGKQDALVSGTNIKTINNQSILGSGDLTISGGGSGIVFGEDGWIIHLANDVEPGIYVSKSGYAELQLYDLEETRKIIEMPFGFFYVVKKYSEASNGEIFLTYLDGYNSMSYAKSNNTTGYAGPYYNAGEWVKKSNVLLKDNTTSFTPSADYNPATKKYVDDAVAGAGGGDGLPVYLVGNKDTTNSEGVLIPLETLKAGIYRPIYTEEKLWLTHGGNQYFSIYLMDDFIVFKDYADAELNEIFASTVRWDDISSPKMKIIYLKKTNSEWGYDEDYSKTGGLPHYQNYPFISRFEQQLGVEGQWYFNYYAPQCSVAPTVDDSLTNKKYVDDKPTTYTGYDATKTQVLKNINGTLTWVDE